MTKSMLTEERAGEPVQMTFRMGEAEDFRLDKALAAADAMEDGEIAVRLRPNEAR